jgi:hypothetical protein
VGPFDPSNPNFPLYIEMMQGRSNSNRGRGGGCGTGCGCVAILLAAVTLFALFVAIGAR